MTPPAEGRPDRAVRWLFLLAALFIAFQGLVIVVVEEPYPSFRLPDFQTSPERSGYVERDTPLLSVDFTVGSAAVPTPLLFAGADNPDALASLIFPESPRGQGARASLRLRIRRYVDAVGVFKGSRSSSPQTARWLRERLATLYPGRTPVQFRVRWTRERYTLGGVRRSSVTLRTVTVPLSR